MESDLRSGNSLVEYFKAEAGFQMLFSIDQLIWSRHSKIVYHQKIGSALHKETRMERLLRPALAILLFALTACSDPSPATATQDHEPAHVSTAQCKPSVHPFWTKFRAAILKEDWNAVAELTEFPLVIHTWSPAAEKRVSRQDLAKQFPQFLNAPHGESYARSDLSMKGLVQSIPTLAKDECGDFEEQLVIGQWRFFLRPDGWRLGVIYVNAFPSSMKHIPLEP